MHDETCKLFAKVLGGAWRGLPGTDARELESEGRRASLRGAGENQRPSDHVRGGAVAGTVFPHRHRNMIRWLDRCRINGIPVYGQGITTEAGLTFTFEDWNLFDDSDSWREVTTGTIEERKAKLADPSRRHGLKTNLPREGLITSFFDQIVITQVIDDKLRHLEGLTLAQGGRARRQGPGRRDVRPGRGRQSQDRVLRPAINRDPALMKEIIDYPYITFGVSDGGAHTKFLTAGRYPTEGIATFVREREWLTLEEIHWRLSALPRVLRRFQGPWLPARGRAGRYRDLRLRKAWRRAGRDRARSAGQ